MEMVSKFAKRGAFLSLLFLHSYKVYSQDSLYNKFQIGFQIFNEAMLSNNGIFATHDGQLYDDYKEYLKATNSVILNQGPRTYLGFNQSKILLNINGGYNFDYNNSVVLFIQFSYRYNTIEFYDKSFTIGNNSDYGDLNLNLVYFRNIKLSNFISLKLGVGGGLIFSTVNELNDVYGLTRFSRNNYNDKNAYFFEDGQRVVTTRNLFRNNIDINVTPRIQLDFTRKRKSYFSIVGGLNIIPFNYLGVESEVYDLSTNKVTNSLITKFKSSTYFIGIGYTYGWKSSN